MYDSSIDKRFSIISSLVPKNSFIEVVQFDIFMDNTFFVYYPVLNVYIHTNVVYLPEVVYFYDVAKRTRQGFLYGLLFPLCILQQNHKILISKV